MRKGKEKNRCWKESNGFNAHRRRKFATNFEIRFWISFSATCTRTMKDLYAMIRQLGIPTWFATFSAGETRWDETMDALKSQNDKRATKTLNEQKNDIS